MQKVSAWRQVFAEHLPEGAPTQVNLDDSAKAEFESATAAVVRAVRKQLDPSDKASLSDLSHVLFDKAAPQSSG